MKKINLLVFFYVGLGCNFSLYGMKSLKKHLPLLKFHGRVMSTKTQTYYTHDLRRFKPELLLFENLEYIWEKNSEQELAHQFQNASAEHKNIIRQIVMKGIADLRRDLDEYNGMLSSMYTIFRKEPILLNRMNDENFKEIMMNLKKKNWHLGEHWFNAHKIMSDLSLEQFGNIYHSLDMRHRFLLLKEFHNFFSAHNDKFVSKEIGLWAHYVLKISELDFGQDYINCLEVEMRYDDDIPYIRVLKDWV